MHIDSDRLEAFAAGRLRQPEAAEVETHLLECNECGERFDKIDLRSDSFVAALRDIEATKEIAYRDGRPVPGPTASGSSPWSFAGSRLGCYELYEEIGRGGMGVVYSAYDVQLNRMVAVKLIAPGRVALDARFRREAMAVARLHHANIVQLLDFGEERGVPFAAFELVDGGNLAIRLKAAPICAKDAAGIVATLADAMHYAHSRKVIHRDLKPSNILFDQDGTPKIADFGLAKTLDDQSRHTVEGSVLGSPAYMSPEQASGKTDLVGPASDVYSLGAILYHAVTGQPPFESESALATIELVKNGEPVPPSRLSRDLDLDLDSICLKCLEKSPDQRYASAADLATDLRRFLSSVPVRARKASQLRRAVKLVKRHPCVSGFTGLFVIVVICFTAQMRIARDEANRRAELSRRAAYSLQLTRAGDLCATDPQQAQELLQDELFCPKDLRDFSWRRLNAVSQRVLSRWESPRKIISLATSPRGDLFVTGDELGKVRVWTLRARQPLFECQVQQAAATDVAFSHDGEFLAVSSDAGDVSLWSIASHEMICATPVLEGRVNSVAFSPDSETLATAHSDGSIQIWRVPTLESVHHWKAHNESVLRVSFNANGKYLASGSNDESLIVWRATNWERHGAPIKNESAVNSVRFHSTRPDLLAAATKDRLVQLWTISDDGLIEPHAPAIGFASLVNSIAFSPDGGLIATGCDDRTVRVWPVASPEEPMVLRQRGEAIAVAFTDNWSLIVGAWERDIQRWDLRPREEELISVHEGGVTGITYSSDGKFLASSSDDCTVRLWRAEDRETVRKSVASWDNGSDSARVFGASPDHRIWAWQKGKQVLYLTWDVARQMAPLIRECGFYPNQLAISPSADCLFASHYGGVTALPLPDGKPLWNWETSDVTVLTYSATSSQIAAGADDQLYMGDPKTGEFAPLLKCASIVTAAVFSTDGRALAVGTVDGEVAVVAVPGGATIARCRRLAGSILCLTFSHDGKTLATGDTTGEVRLWDAVEGLERDHLSAVRPVLALAFSPADTALACGTDDGEIRIWSAEPRPMGAH